MKTIFRSALLLLCTAGLFAACDSDNDSNPTITVPTTELQLNVPAPGADGTYDLSDGEPLEFTCSRVSYGYQAVVSYKVSYSIHADMSDAVEGSDASTDTVVTVEAKEMASALTDQLVAEGRTKDDFPVTTDVYVRVTATLQTAMGGGVEGTAVSSEVKKLTNVSVPYMTNIVYIYETGNESGWSTNNPLSGSGDGKYQGFYYLNGDFKFKQEEANWDVNWGAGGNGVLVSNGGNLSADEGFYQIDVDIDALTYKLTKVDQISVIGNMGGWAEDSDQDLTYNVNDGAWEADNIKVDGEFKFRMNHAWDVSWGGTLDAIVLNGDNLSLPAGTYSFKLTLGCTGYYKLEYTKQD